MRNCLLGGCRGHPFPRPGAERPAGCRENQLFNIAGILGLKHLENGIMLGIEGQETRAGPFGCREHQVTGTNQALLVRKRHERALPDR